MSRWKLPEAFAKGVTPDNWQDGPNSTYLCLALRIDATSLEESRALARTVCERVARVVGLLAGKVAVSQSGGEYAYACLSAARHTLERLDDPERAEVLRQFRDLGELVELLVPPASGRPARPDNVVDLPTRPYLTHTYDGPAWLMDDHGRCVRQEQIAGAFHIQSPAVGGGVVLVNGERPEVRWYVTPSNVDRLVEA